MNVNRRTVNGEAYITEFESISDLIQFVKTNDYQSEFINHNKHDSTNTETYFCNNSNTNSYEEAEELLLHGWEHGAVEIKNKVDVKSTGVEMKQKTVYDVAGFQCSVPKYLQGVPTNMINKKDMKRIIFLVWWSLIRIK